MSNDRLTMTNLYQRLKEIGFTKEFIRSIGLPSWWVDELDITVNTISSGLSFFYYFYILLIEIFYL